MLPHTRLSIRPKRARFVSLLSFSTKLFYLRYYTFPGPASLPHHILLPRRIMCQRYPIRNPFILSTLLHLALLHHLAYAASPTMQPQSSPKPTPCPQKPGLIARPANFSLYVLAMQWPFSVCVSTPGPPSSPCRAPPASFTVRGLWPTNFAPGTSPRCCGSPFSLAPILDIAPALRRLWPDLSKSENDLALWERQWTQHGSCSGLSLRTYFRKVLELSRRYDFLRSLNAQGIVASASKNHAFETVQNAVNEATGGYHVRMRCQRARNVMYLDAVQVCLHRTRFETVDCPEQCLDGDVGCCQPEDSIRIPFWRHERNSPNGTSTWTPSDEDRNERNSGFWVGQIAGVFVLGGGLAYWLFKQFFEPRRDSRYPRPNRTDYQLLPSSAR